ncbi:MAG TPA: putative Ig domain-containing protein, partial [Limnobacter sp.]|nr:putative Ig domain-containing protein [Limnobacter sp.]
QTVLIPGTKAGSYYVLVSSANRTSLPAVLRADLLPLSITQVSPDRMGVGNADQRWVTVDIRGAQFKPGALVRLSRPGVFEVEPTRWQVLDSTHIRAIFDTRNFPKGLYDVTVINPDGQRITEAQRLLIERGIEADVTIGLGGDRTIEPGAGAVYSVSLQSLTNVDTPYVRFDFGATEMGYSEPLLEGLRLPFVVFGTNVAGRPDGATVDAAGNTQAYGPTPTNGTPRKDIAWASLDGVVNTNGYNLAPGYAFDVPAGGFAGMSFNVQTYPGFKEWAEYDFPGLRDKLYALNPEWKAQGLLDNGPGDLNKISPGLTRKFFSREPNEHITIMEAASLPFRFNVVAAATALTRAEFIAEQSKHARALRSAILADKDASVELQTLAADEDQWVQGWLGALEAAGMLRPADEAPPIRESTKVLSLNATLASGILLSKAGTVYKTQADIAAFFSQVQAWYGDTAKHAGDRNAKVVDFEYHEIRETQDGVVTSPVPVMANPADYDQGAVRDTHFINFMVYAGQLAELEHLRNMGLLDEKFRPVPGKPVNLSRYLDLIASVTESTLDDVSIRGPQGVQGEGDKQYVPANAPLPYTIQFGSASETPTGQIRVVQSLDSDLDLRTVRIGNIKIGDINIHVPSDQVNFQQDFDFSGSKGFILRISAGVELQERVITWLIQAIDPDTGEVLQDATRGLLQSVVGASDSDRKAQKRGSVSYTVQALATATTGSTLDAKARVLLDDLPAIDSELTSVTLDAGSPSTALTVRSLGNNPLGQSVYDLKWLASDDASGVKGVTLYVAENGGDFKIWQRQVPPATSQMVFVGNPNTRYEFIAVATDNAGNREAASVANAVLPDDGARQAVLDTLGVVEQVSQTGEVPRAPEDRDYPANADFQKASQLLPGHVARQQTGDFKQVLAPFAAKSFASGFEQSEAGIGAQAMVELPDGRILVSAGALRNEVFAFANKGGRSTTPLFELSEPIVDMAVDALGQLWVMTGRVLLQVDAGTGAVVRTVAGPADAPMTHAMAIHPETGELYVSFGDGIKVFNPASAQEGEPLWRTFSSMRVGDLAFGPDKRLWAVRWSGTEITAASGFPTTDVVSFPMTGRTQGRGELEYRLNAVIDSIAFGHAGSAMAGLLFASSNTSQQPAGGSAEAARDAQLWMIELDSRRVLQLAKGGSRGESVVATRDGRVLVAQTSHVDEIALAKAPVVQAVTVPDGALVPLPLQRIGVVFDQAMLVGTGEELGSVLNVQNYALSALGNNASSVYLPKAVTWDPARNTAWLELDRLAAGQYQLEIRARLQSDAELPMETSFISNFTALNDLTAQLRLQFSNTRADRATGAVSYDVVVSNVGDDDLLGPITLLLDPGQYFAGSIDSGVQGTGDQSSLWMLNLNTALVAAGGRLKTGSSLAPVTVSMVPAATFASRAGMADLVKATLGHGVYAYPQGNTPPQLGVPLTDTLFDEEGFELPVASVGQTWSADIQAYDADGRTFFWELIQAPPGMTLTPSSDVRAESLGYTSRARLHWLVGPNADAKTEVLVRVQDNRGSAAYRYYTIAVTGGNHAPVLGVGSEFRLLEGQPFVLPIISSDMDGDVLTVSMAGAPAGSRFDAKTGVFSWVPGYDQAGEYNNIKVLVSDGKRTTSATFKLIVEQGYPVATIQPAPKQVLLEGRRHTLQLQAQLPGDLVQADGATGKVEFESRLLPIGASLNPETGWLDWTPEFTQQGNYSLEFTAVTTWTQANGDTQTTRRNQRIDFEVLNANGAPQFLPAETWTVLEGQPLRVSVFAFDPDNPEFWPKMRTSVGSGVAEEASTPATVQYTVTGLPEGAEFDAETLELVWTPGYQQAGRYVVTVLATDDGDGTGVPARSELIVPIVVENANRAPIVGDMGNAFVDRGAVLDVPVFATDLDGNAVTIQLDGLPRFAQFIQQTGLENGQAAGVLRFSPGEGDRGDHVITVAAYDDGHGAQSARLADVKTFVLTVRSVSEAPVITAPRQVVALAGQPLTIDLLATDLDQDELTWQVDGLPAGAVFAQRPQYGQASIAWTPSAAVAGIYDIAIAVTDRGLPPRDSGYATPDNPKPNQTNHTLRIVVRESNEAPQLFGVEVNGQALSITPSVQEDIAVQAQEGTPLSVRLFASDADLDFLQWKVTGLPAGAQLSPSQNGRELRLEWIPGLLDAQASNTGVPGVWSLQVRASDGVAEFTRTLVVRVQNVNQVPRILALPRQLAFEGETVSFVVNGVDRDGDSTRLSLVFDEQLPSGVFFDPTSGYFEWTPDFDAVNNATETERPYAFKFRVSDGVDFTEQTVQVRLFDVNR